MKNQPAHKELKSPPGQPVKWLVTPINTKGWATVVVAKTAFEAAAKLGYGLSQVSVVRKDGE